jgi:hypothetical protein
MLQQMVVLIAWDERYGTGGLAVNGFLALTELVGATSGFKGSRKLTGTPIE